MDLSVDNKSDSLFIQIINTKTRNIIIGVIYKPSDMDIIKFNEDLDITLEIISKEHQACTLLGEFKLLTY